MKTPPTVNLKDVEFLCSKCVKNLGGVFQDQYLTASHFSYCDCCGEKRALYDKKNWDNLKYKME